MPANQAQIAAAIAAHGAAKVHSAAYAAMGGNRSALSEVGLPTDGSIGHIDAIGRTAFAAMSLVNKSADLADITIKQAQR